MDAVPQSNGFSGQKNLKILMLHGYAQTGEIFHASTRRLEKAIANALEDKSMSATFLYPTGPVHLNPRQFASFVPDTTNNKDDQLYSTYTWFHYISDTEFRFEMGIDAIQTLIEEIGGIDGVCGFSTGGALASIIAAALESDRNVPDSCAYSWVYALRKANKGQALQFSVIYSGFVPPDPKLDWCFSPKIRTPTLHFMGELDTMIDKETSQQLVNLCDEPEILVHPGGHFVPKFGSWTDAAAQFIVGSRESGVSTHLIAKENVVA